MTPTSPVSSVRLASRIACLSGSVARDILSRTQDREIVNFAGGLPDPLIWQDLELPQVPAHAFQYGPSEGELPLRRLLAEQATALGLPTSPDRVLVTSGSQQGLDLVAKLLIDPGTPVLLESPTYLAALQVMQLFQADLHGLAVDSEGFDPEELDSKLAATQAPLVYLNPTFQNPSGICYSEKRRREIAEVIDRRGAVLLEDDPYRDLYYASEPPPPPLCSLLKKSPWIYLSSVSKTLLPALRVGALHCSPCLFEPLLKLKQAADLHTNRPAQFVAVSLLADKARHDHRLDSLRERYASKRDLAARALEARLSGRATWQEPQGGMFFWVRLNQPTDLRRLLDRCLQRGVAFMPGDPFFADPSHHGRHLRINFTQAPTEAMPDGIGIIADCLAEQLD